MIQSNTRPLVFCVFKNHLVCMLNQSFPIEQKNKPTHCNEHWFHIFFLQPTYIALAAGSSIQLSFLLTLQWAYDYLFMLGSTSHKMAVGCWLTAVGWRGVLGMYDIKFLHICWLPFLFFRKGQDFVLQAWQGGIEYSKSRLQICYQNMVTKHTTSVKCGRVFCCCCCWSLPYR